MKLRSNEPFWLVKNGLIQSYPSLDENITTEILVVGSGITGSLIAHRCMEDGYQTVLIDRREIAHGSTSATTSMLQYEIDVPLYKLIEQIGAEGATASFKACYESIDTLRKVCQQVKSACGFKKKDSLYFAAFKKDVQWLKKELEARKDLKLPVSWLSSEEIEQHYGLSNTCGGILSRQGASIDAFRLTHDILSFNHNRGLRIYDKTNVSKVQYKRSRAVVLTENGHSITANKIVYCTGFESTEMIKDKFVNLISTFAIVGEQSKNNLSPLNNTLFWNTAKPYIYLRTTDDNRLLIGGEDETYQDSKRRDLVLDTKSIKLEKQIRKLLPEQQFTTDFVWAGTFGETKDGLPYIGAHPNFPHSYFVLGFGGNGITFSVIGMDMISSMLKGDEHPLSHYFRFRR